MPVELIIKTASGKAAAPTPTLFSWCQILHILKKFVPPAPRLYPAAHEPDWGAVWDRLFLAELQ